MRNQYIPRIKEILSINHFNIICRFSNDENRIIDFKKLFTFWKQNQEKYPIELENQEIFRTVTLQNKTLTWETIQKEIQLSNGLVFHVSYDIDPIVLFENSILAEVLMD